MPSAAPVPRTPSVLTLHSAGDLLTGPRCAVCRYVGEASDRYLTWFAFEGHADPVVLTRLCQSLGMCGRHTRLLMSQPGAATRLTAVYGYLLRSARERLAGPSADLAPCMACEHDDAAARRALGVLLDGLPEGSACRQRYRELGGLCVPHFSAAARLGPKPTANWLAAVMAASFVAHAPAIAWLAGDYDHDAEVRAVLARTIPPVAKPDSYVCMACHSAALAERDYLARLTRLRDESRDPGLLLCARHLGDAAVLASPGQGLASLLIWQANGHLARATGTGTFAGKPAAWPAIGRRRPSPAADCAVCRTRQGAAQRALDGYRESLRTRQLSPGESTDLCVGHVLVLTKSDPRAGHKTDRAAAGRAGMLIAELARAFGAGTWDRRGELTDEDKSAWRRAAAFLDGNVFAGSPPYGI